MGSRLYVVAMSKSDQRKGLDGSRSWFWAKDVNASNQNSKRSPNDLQYICDVDYYMDMPEFLAERSVPTLLYTTVPEAAASTGEDDTSFTFDNDGSLVTIITGGGTYKHHLWDYAQDSCLVSKTFLWFFKYKTIVYAIERKQVTKHRQLVLFSPIREFGWLSGLLARSILDHKPLKRFNPVQVHKSETFIRFNVVKPNGDLLCTTSRPNEFLCATVPIQDDNAVATVARLGTMQLMLPTTHSWIKDRHHAAVLTAYHRVANPCAAPYVFPVANAVRTYHYNTDTYHQDDRSKIQAFMSPLVHCAFAPVNNQASEEACVTGRITSLRKTEPKYNRFRDQCMDEFANFICRETLHPVPFEDIYDKQKSANQRMSLAKAVVMGCHRPRVLKCFLKAEAYPQVKDPRNISTYNDADKLDMATYASALSDHLKKFNWYAPGMTPLTIANRVVEICEHAEFVNVSDYHRMDGTITYCLRKVDRAVVMRFFPNHRTHLNELLKTNVDNKGYLPHGTTFDQGPSHGSGCSATSVFQTLRAAFTAYLAFRKTRRADGSHYNPEAAFSALGLHCGDDGIDADLPSETHEAAAKSVGLSLDVVLIPRYERGVNFLSRYFSPEVWTGSPHSMCDITRQLAKLHVTTRLPNGYENSLKLIEKSLSFVATDRNTPVLGELCQRVLSVTDIRPSRSMGIGQWWSKFEQSVQYPNDNVDQWMDAEFNIRMPAFARSTFNTWLASANTVKELLLPPICTPFVAAAPTIVDVIVDDDVVEARPNDVPPEPETQTATGHQVCARTPSLHSTHTESLSSTTASNPVKAVARITIRSSRHKMKQPRQTKTTQSGVGSS
jgi:hypothetical protein